MIKRLKNNIIFFKKIFFTIVSLLFGLLSFIQAFYSWEDLGIHKFSVKLAISVGIIFVSLAWASFNVFLKNEKMIWGDQNRGLKLQYGDIKNIGFPKKWKEERIVVIPVNCCFDTSCENGLISPNSIHGQWIKKMIITSEDREKIDEQIKLSLNRQKIQKDTLSRERKSIGNLTRYPYGTVAVVQGSNGVVFYLLAIAQLDKDLKAHCTERKYFESVQKLIEFYDSRGQAHNLYCPVMGDHIIRPVRDTTDAVQMMISIFRFNRINIHGTVTIVVYDKMKNDVSISNY